MLFYCILKLDGRAEEEGDQTGDSGMGTGSGAGTIEEWKKGIQNPPAGICVYISIIAVFCRL